MLTNLDSILCIDQLFGLGAAKTSPRQMELPNKDFTIAGSLVIAVHGLDAEHAPSAEDEGCNSRREKYPWPPRVPEGFPERMYFCLFTLKLKPSPC
jgi:hypothetical protein